MAESFFIIVPFLNDFEPSSGTTIRIAGYTRGLEELGADYRFLSAVRPGYVPPEKHEPLTFSRKWIKVLLVHNLLFSKPWLRPLSAPLRFLSDNVAGIREIAKKINDRLIWAHQENTLALYFYFIYKKTFIYDAHGFFDIQRNNRPNLSLWKKLWFDMHLKHEQVVIKLAPYINVVSERMLQYVRMRFLPIGNIKLAPDGIPSPLFKYAEIEPNRTFRTENGLSESDKIIIFAGSFKLIGGASELLRIFIENEKLHLNAVLLLIGTGQEEHLIINQIKACKIKHRIFHLRHVPHKTLISFYKISDVIVCPDLKENFYNEITPHIKLYDAIASGKVVVATDFEVNRELFDPDNYNILYFNNNHSLADVIYKALFLVNIREKQIGDLEALTYKARTINYLNSFNIANVGKKN